MESDITHIEAWSVAITPSPGEEWPLIPAGGDYQMRPDLILVQVLPDQPASVTGSGRRTRRDGTEGSLRVNAPWRVLGDLPDWARKFTDDTLGGSGLDQHITHEIAPLPGSVRARNGLKIRDGALPDLAILYPVTGICSYCHDPIRICRMGEPWQPEG
jgi:hypothetical protein